MKELIEKINSQLQMEENEIRQYSPLGLAYLGDAVFDLIIRTMVVKEGNAPVQKYHLLVSKYVKASAQAEMVKKIQHLLTEEEQQVFKRGRNAKSGTIPKNALLIDYKNATGLEALVGYLYLKGKYDRIFYLISQGLPQE